MIVKNFKQIRAEIEMNPAVLRSYQNSLPTWWRCVEEHLGMIYLLWMLFPLLLLVTVGKSLQADQLHAVWVPSVIFAFWWMLFGAQWVGRRITQWMDACSYAMFISKRQILGDAIVPEKYIRNLERRFFRQIIKDDKMPGPASFEDGC